MGFDLARFIGEIDEEFQCSICSMVLENAVQTPCDHLLCSECIEKWLTTNTSCPVDRIPLTITDLKPTCRYLLNLLSKLDIKCDFDSQGCNAVLKLEGLQGHIASCDYNPDVQIVCDKGCNLEMSRREYQTSNCHTHLSINHKREIARLLQELGNQKEHSDRLAHRQGEAIGRLSNEVIQLRREKHQLKCVASQQKGKIRKLSYDVHQLSQQQIPKAPLKWELIRNLNSPFDQPYVLETTNKYSEGFVRSFLALEPKHSSFKIQVLNGRFFMVGLSSKGETNTQLGNWFTCYYGASGIFEINNVEYCTRSNKIGDIIELGIKFPWNFVSNGNASVELYLSINERVVTTKVIKMPMDTIYPTIQIRVNTKIKYFDI